MAYNYEKTEDVAPLKMWTKGVKVEDKADQVGEIDLAAFVRVDDAWNQLLAHATGAGM